MDDTLQSTNKTGFFKSFFSLSQEEKAESLNFLQYTILALIPLIILERVNQLTWPKSDDKKGSIEILAEILGQTLFTIVIVFIVYRVIDFIPTYSGIPLKGINMLSIVTVFMLTLPWYDSTSNLGSKIKILQDRIDKYMPSFFGVDKDKTQRTSSDSSSGNGNSNGNGNGDGNGGGLQIPMPTHASSRADYLGAHSNMSVTGGNANPVNFDSMYQQNTPSQPVQEAMQQPELMAANEALGGSFGSAW